jgi:bifunctional enzyme CysN/CysC
MGEKPLDLGGAYKLKIATLSIGAKVTAIKKVMDTSSLATVPGRRQVKVNEAAECEIETTGPVVCDLISQCEATGRFVLVDGYEIAGGGMITAIL